MSRRYVVCTRFITISEQFATVGVLRELINCRDGINVIDYFNHDEITGIIDELCTN